jgi:hypothetical protein
MVIDEGVFVGDKLASKRIIGLEMRRVYGRNAEYLTSNEDLVARQARIPIAW